MAQANQAIRFARTYLNDINGNTWGDPVLMSFLQIAHSELVQGLELNRTGVMKVQSPVIVVPAGAVSLGYSQPSNIINPISMMEGSVGADPDSFEDMIKVAFLPFADQTTELNYWAWIGQQIAFLGATSDRQVILRYDGALTAPQNLTDQLGCIFAENYIGPRIVSLAFTAAGKDNRRIQELADSNLYKLIQSQVSNDQRPTRRLAYRSRKRASAGGISIPVSAAIGGLVTAVDQWIPTTTPPDGHITLFAFPKVPRFISWNGINQTVNIGYKLFASNSNALITFIDVDGNVLIPGPTDTIYAVNGSVQTAPLTAPNGVVELFVFSVVPQYILWNSLNQFLGTGYRQSIVNDTLVYFIDNLGNTLTPGPQDDIREAV